MNNIRDKYGTRLAAQWTPAATGIMNIRVVQSGVYSGTYAPVVVNMYLTPSQADRLAEGIRLFIQAARKEEGK